jgi:hypothetical protein
MSLVPEEQTQHNTNIIIVHLGEDLPLYIRDCIEQIRIWNSREHVKIFFIAFTQHYEMMEPICQEFDVTFVSTETLPKTENHKYFLANYKNYDAAFRNGYWRFVIERFYYMEELMITYNLDSAIHMEYDVMLYSDFSILQPKLNEYIKGLALSFDNDNEGYPSFIVINSIGALELLNGFIAINCNAGLTDMRLLSVFCKVFPDQMESLPQIPTAIYKGKTERKSLTGVKAEGSTAYLANKFEELGSVIFDSLAIGQYVCGVDPRNTNGICIIEYPNESAFYTVDEFGGLTWKQDEKKRWYLETAAGYRIVNIHVHSKRLSYFLSNRSDQPKCDYTDVQLARLA